MSGQSSVTWQGPPVSPPSTPNVFPDAKSPITLNGQVDSSTGAISGATLTLPGLPQPEQEGESTTFTFSEVNPGTATGTFDSATGAVTLNDTFTLTFVGTGTEPITCVSTPIPVAFSGTWDSATQNVTLSASGFTIPQFSPNSGQNCSLAASSLNTSPGGVAGAVGNAFSIALHGQFAPGLPTTTTLAASPSSPQLAGTSVTLTATVTDPSNQGTPTGTVTFNDNGASIGTGTLSGSGSSPTATLTTTTLPSGADQQLTATYSGDPTYAPSTSAAQPYTVTPLPTVGATLPTSMTVPSLQAPPTVSAPSGVASALTPDAGPAAGGTKVTIAGNGFTPTASVSFGSTPATAVTYVNPTELIATSPAGTGIVAVTVTTSTGTSATSSADQFFYGAPTVTAVSPNPGPANSSFNFVAITGNGFTPNATVNFGSIAAGSIKVNSPTSIYAVAPSAPASTVDVTVTTPAGTSATSAADHYTYSAAPAVANLATPAGPAAGGTSVTITGANFTGATAVDFGSTPAASFTVSSATSITAVSPAGTSGTAVDVTVTTPNGTSATWLYDQFTYGPPTVTGISPSGGPAAGGTSVTITGTGFAPSGTFSDGPSVKFGTSSISASSVTVNSPTSLTVAAPAGTGTVDVTVTTKSGGTSATSAADEFTYAPTVTGISPLSGPTAGGTAVTITGTGFTGAAAVNFGTAAATNVTVVSSTEITATSPAGTAGNANVTVTTPVGTSVTSTADQFFYGPPTVTAVSPGAGPTTGGTTVTVTGTGLSGANAVKFGSTAATSYAVVSPTQLTAVSPAGSGLTHIVVTTNGGTSSATAAAADFTFNTAPSVTSLTPDTGSPNGGTGVTITGVNFTAAAGVSFGTTPATAFTVVSPTTITATSPAGTGAVDVTVSSASGTSATGPGDVFGYGAPTVTGVAPSGGVTSGGTSVIITGTGFVSGTTVNFGSVAAASMTITSPTSITAVSPAEAAGAVHVTVTNSAGTSTTSPSDVFTYSAGGLPGQASLTFTNPSMGQSWSQLYAEIVFSLNGGTSSGDEQPASNLTLSYQDSSGGWCPLTLTASGKGTSSSPSILTGYFSGIGSSCGSAPGSFSLAPGVSLTVPIQLTYASGTYLGAQSVTASLYSGTCSSATSCTQSGALNGAAAGSSTVELSPPARLPVTLTDQALPTKPTSPVHQGFNLQLDVKVAAAVTATGTPTPTGTLEFLVDGSPIALTSDGVTPVANPVPLYSTGATLQKYYSTAGLSPGTHTLTSVYSGDGVFAPSTLTETLTVLPAPAGTPFVCNAIGALVGSFTSMGYVTTTSQPPTPTPSGSNATVTNATVALDVDPYVGGDMPSTQNPVPFTLSPGGTAVATSGTSTTSATDDLYTWSISSAQVPITGEPGASIPVSVGSFAYSSSSGGSFTCSPVSADAPMTSVTVAGNTLTASPSGAAAPGTPVTLTDTVAPVPTSSPGTVQFFDGSTVLGSSPVSTTTGTATYTTNSLALGSHQLSAAWSGTLSIPPTTSNTVDYTVGTATTTSLASSANPANAANPITFTATVSPPDGDTTQPTGDVSFTSDGNPISGCSNQPLSMASPPTATCTTSFGAGESHAIVATYSGDGTYIGSASDTLTQTTLPGTNTTILSTKDPSQAGNVTFWSGVSPSSGKGATPTGTVAFSIDGSTYKPCASQPLGPGGGASCTVSFKAGTTHKIFATYAGSASYSGSKSSTITQTVTGSKSSTTPKDTGGSATLPSGKTLTANQSISTGSYTLVMQGDGNLVEYQGSKALWASGTSGHAGTGVVMQKDGNLVEYQGGKAIWASGTAGHTGAHLTLQGTDGNVVIYTTANKAVWNTGT